MARVTVEVDDSVLEALQRLAKKVDGNLADAVAKAVATADYLDNNSEDGKVLIKKGGTLHEVALG
jgi:hypothetical protein